jgi:hypothetical protein
MINAVAFVKEFYWAMCTADVEHIAALHSPNFERTGAESPPPYNGLWRGPRDVECYLVGLIFRSSNR